MGAVLSQKAICVLLKDKGAAKPPCTHVAETQHQGILPVVLLVTFASSVNCKQTYNVACYADDNGVLATMTAFRYGSNLLEVFLSRWLKKINGVCYYKA